MNESGFLGQRKTQRGGMRAGGTRAAKRFAEPSQAAGPPSARSRGGLSCPKACLKSQTALFVNVIHWMGVCTDYGLQGLNAVREIQRKWVFLNKQTASPAFPSPPAVRCFTRWRCFGRGSSARCSCLVWPIDT